MISEQVRQAGPVPMFWCQVCHKRKAMEACHRIEGEVHVAARLYRSGVCRACHVKFEPLSADDAIDLHEALAVLVSFRESD